ncbi:hypothetical protein AX774_g4519 [Zancudomyces culisetae]|uniref:Uncharacterized protein n=1 Tax=Zancudomyces culisetae TaxID=1213189 RepID=A0A1R1PM36_ZANCU|nr:hypothetical protein AX774_g4519 [Zancudomyces culisetae]|eukprot:OMH82016.1 hypothetical protein AX774_g4519 [Zancudomyces culisetae]
MKFIAAVLPTLLATSLATIEIGKCDMSSPEIVLRTNETDFTYTCPEGFTCKKRNEKLVECVNEDVTKGMCILACELDCSDEITKVEDESQEKVAKRMYVPQKRQDVSPVTEPASSSDDKPQGDGTGQESKAGSTGQESQSGSTGQESQSGSTEQGSKSGGTEQGPQGGGSGSDSQNTPPTDDTKNEAAAPADDSKKEAVVDETKKKAAADETKKETAVEDTEKSKTNTGATNTNLNNQTDNSGDSDKNKSDATTILGYLDVKSLIAAQAVLFVFSILLIN